MIHTLSSSPTCIPATCSPSSIHLPIYPALQSFVVAGGGLLSAPAPPAATFSGLPPTRVLTLNLDAPEAWLAEPIEAPLDLDNLRLADLGPGRRALAAAFELEALMLTGSCIDVAAKKREQVAQRY